MRGRRLKVQCTKPHQDDANRDELEAARDVKGHHIMDLSGCVGAGGRVGGGAGVQVGEQTLPRTSAIPVSKIASLSTYAIKKRMLRQKFA